MIRRHHKAWRAVMWIAAAGCLPLTGQTTVQGAGTGTTPPALEPGSPAGSYALSGFEDVNLYNGHLNVHLPLMTVGGRGDAGYQMQLGISQPSWVVETTGTFNAGDTTTPAGYTFTSGLSGPAEWWNPYQVRYGPGSVVWKQIGSGIQTCTGSGAPFYSATWSYVVFTAPDGTEHPLYGTGSGPSVWNAACAVTPPQRGPNFVARDGTDMLFVADNTGYFMDNPTPGAAPNGATVSGISGTLYLRDGTQYSVGHGLAGGGMIDSIQDRHGNVLRIGYMTGQVDGETVTQPFVTTITDSLGRQTTIAYDQTDATYGTYDLITFPGANGAARYLRIVRAAVSASLRRDFSAGSPFFPGIVRGGAYADRSEPGDSAEREGIRFSL